MDKKIIDIEALKYYNKKISESKQDKLVSGENIKTINGDSILEDGNLNIETIEIEYNQLKSLRDNSQLIPGASYRITDYITTTIQENTTSAGHQFDIIVTALDESTLSEEAKAIQHDGDTYFNTANLSAWQLWYCLDNDDARFGWVDTTNGKGVIYRMIDEFNNDCPYDFKNILFLRDVFTNGDGLASTTGQETESKPCYTFGYEQEDGSMFDATVVDATIIVMNVYV